MAFHRLRRPYEQLSQFENGRIISMNDVGWLARRVARQLGRSVCVARRCWYQWIREMSFTRRPRSGRTRQTSRREDHHIVRNARVQPACSSAAIQTLWWHAQGNWTAAEWNEVIFSDESRFNLSNDGNHVRVWRPRGEFLNPAFALQRDTISTTGLMVWDAIAYNTWLLLVLIRYTMTAVRYVHIILQPHVLPLQERHRGAIFQQVNARPLTARVPQDFLRTDTTLPWSSHQICLQSSISGIIWNGK
ncbi:transposable element Tcb2 transposase [Trichonephila clavipes]|nr:transposable element Tcb2 transposase [Trichonephila clavipes]